MPAAPARRRKRGLSRLLFRSAVATVAAAAALAGCGAAYEAISSTYDAVTYPATGRLLDIGGYSLYLDCRGEGFPTIVMDAGLGGSSLNWSLVQPALAATSHVCTYDRAGMGRSESSPLPRTPARLADELHTLLARAGVPGPYLLVGHSLAGKTVRLFAGAHPDEVAGMVLVDARSEYVDARVPQAEADAFGAALETQGLLYRIARASGLARAFATALIGAAVLPTATATEMVLQQTTPEAIAATTAEGMARAADDAALAGTSLGALPLVVIAADASLSELPKWQVAQVQMAALSSRGRLVVAGHSGHDVPIERPAVVIDAVRTVVSDIRSGF
jgi:pimeloyl-ACP methyl ester carboxylesterase